ncbi:alpha/beta hydrolase [Phenylobacterium sp.]|uniref:alpha/beta fold hydrolase n=1 Tax=Phenylobacterium sp. TaxID=1871053 RepID=UPI002F4272CA
MFKLFLGLAATLAVSTAAVAQPASDPNRLFADSRLVVRDRFSDEIVGKGPDLVLIPGLASSRATWKATAERLKGHYRLHLIQIAGFAGEPARGNAAGEVLVPTAEAIDAYLVQQKLTPATIVGHSLGGTTTLYISEQHPEHVRKAMMVDSLPWLAALMAPPGTTRAQIEAQMGRMRDMMNAQAGKPMTADQLEPQMAQMSKAKDTRHRVAEWGVASDRTVVARAMYEDTMLDLGPGLATLKTPMVLLYPDYVPLGMPAAAAKSRYEAAYAPARTVSVRMVTDSAHFIMLDNPAAFDAELDAFLAKK